MYVPLWLRTYLSKYVCVYLFMYADVCVYIYIYIHMYIYIYMLGCVGGDCVPVHTCK